MKDLAIIQTAKTMSQAIAPVFLIAGVASMINVMATRYNRIIDRTRSLLREVANNQNQGRNPNPQELHELRILYSRAKLMRLTIIFAIFSVFAVSATVFLLFANMMFGVHFPLAPEIFFIASLTLLLVSLLLFIEDFVMSLKTIKHEMKRILKRDITLP